MLRKPIGPRDRARARVRESTLPDAKVRFELDVSETPRVFLTQSVPHWVPPQLTAASHWHLDGGALASPRMAALRKNTTAKGATTPVTEGVAELRQRKKRSALRRLKGKVRFDLDLSDTRR